MLHSGSTSYQAWARQLCMTVDATVSKQAVFKRMNMQWVEVTRQIAIGALHKLVTNNDHKHKNLPFKRILIQDSTTVHLPDCMRHIYPGNFSYGKQKAAVKINLILNALTGENLLFRILPFTQNEQSLAESILTIAKAGDLILRDLGYHVVQVFKALNKAGVFYISRYRHATNIYTAKDGKPIALKQLLNKRHVTDMVVLYSKQKVPVRLVAIKLDSNVAAERIRKAKQNRDKRLNHSADYYACLQYAIFITNTDAKVVSPDQVFKLYKCRWQIEIVFKAWKQSTKIEQLIPAERVHTQRVEAILLLYLAYLTWFDQRVAAEIRKINSDQNNHPISIIKLYAFAVHQLNPLETVNIQAMLLTYHNYMKLEKRSKPNAIEHLSNVIASFG